MDAGVSFHFFAFLCVGPLISPHRFIGEESVAAGEKLELTDSPTWIIDPIDGTVNFVHRYCLQTKCNYVKAIQ